MRECVLGSDFKTVHGYSRQAALIADKSSLHNAEDFRAPGAEPQAVLCASRLLDVFQGL